MSEKYDIKSEFLGPEVSMKKEIKVLNRTITWRESGIEYEADSRHADLVIRELGLESAKAVTTPGTSETSAEETAREDSPLLGSREATSYRALAARLNYLAADRVDLQFATKCVAKHMSAPREHDWIALKRVGRYLRGSPRLIQMFEFQ